MLCNLFKKAGLYLTYNLFIRLFNSVFTFLFEVLEPLVKSLEHNESISNANYSTIVFIIKVQSLKVDFFSFDYHSLKEV